MLYPTNDLVCESLHLWFLIFFGGMVDCGPFGTLIKVLESLRKMHIHTFWHIFSGDAQSLGLNMDFLVLKAMAYEIWSYLALLMHFTQYTKYHNCAADLPPALPSSC